MDRRNQNVTGEGERKPYQRPRLQTYDGKTGFRARTGQVTQQVNRTSPVKPLGLQLGGS